MDHAWHNPGTLPLPTLDQIEAQKNWELSAVEDAIRQYNTELYETVEHSDGTTTRRPKQLADTAIGLKVMRDVIGDLETYGAALALKNLKTQCLENITSPGARHRPEWHYIVADRDPLELAVITVRALLAIRYNTRHEQVALADVAGRVASLIRDQYELDGWREESKARAQETGEKDLARIMLASVNGQVDQRTYQRWKKKVKDIRRLDWPIEVRRHLGVALVQTAVESCGGWFEITLRRSGRKTTRYVELTPIAVEAIRSIKEEQPLLRPRHYPMVCPPVPWQPQQGEAA